MKCCFGDIVVVEETLIGVVVKSWGRSNRGGEPNYDVYVREYNRIINYPASQVNRYMVRHKYLNEEELEYQQEAVEIMKSEIAAERNLNNEQDEIWEKE